VAIIAEIDNKTAIYCNNSTIITPNHYNNLDMDYVIDYTIARYSSLVLLSGSSNPKEVVC